MQRIAIITKNVEKKMSAGFLLSRVLLRFDQEIEDLIGDLSAVIFTPDGNLWVASDELLGIDRLSPIEPYIFGKHRHFSLKDYLDLFNLKDEIDLEGMDYENNYLWLIGSHSTKRGKPKGKKSEKDIENLAKIKTEANRYLLARIPLVNGELVKSYVSRENPSDKKQAACLQKVGESNLLMEVLAKDEHLGKIISIALPSKDNGLDFEGIAVKHDRVFLGLRGPVLGGWAIILDLEVEERTPGILTLKKIGKAGELYKKHFLSLNGLGIREMCFLGDDLIVLAGPTMALEGALRVFIWHNPLNKKENSISEQKEGELEVLFDLPFIFGSDHAEGITLFPCLGESNSLLVVYDSPDASRKPGKKEIFADVFRLNKS